MPDGLTRNPQQTRIGVFPLGSFPSGYESSKSDFEGTTEYASGIDRKTRFAIQGLEVFSVYCWCPMTDAAITYPFDVAQIPNYGQPAIRRYGGGVNPTLCGGRK